MTTHIYMAVIADSEEDLEAMRPCLAQLKAFGKPYEVKVASAARNPDEVRAWAQGLHDRGLRIILAASSESGHTPSMVAAYSPLPVIGIPLSSDKSDGVDILLSMARSALGVPCATVGVDAVENAAVLAQQMLATGCDHCIDRLLSFKDKLSQGVSMLEAPRLEGDVVVENDSDEGVFA